MIFTKYLFGTIAALTGGVNVWAFTSSGGALVKEELTSLDGEVDSESTQSDQLISVETKRLEQEKSNSQNSFQRLEKQNEEAQNQSRKRRSSGEELTKSDKAIRIHQHSQNYNLNNTKNILEKKLNTQISEFKSKVEQQIQSAFQNVSQSVQQETKKLENALSQLQESNRNLIDKVKNCIIQLPQSIFVEASKLNNKSYCDYVAEQKAQAKS